MRLIVGGGRASEDSKSGGAVVVGVRTLSEGGRVGKFSREQVWYCICNVCDGFCCQYTILNLAVLFTGNIFSSVKIHAGYST